MIEITAEARALAQIQTNLVLALDALDCPSLQTFLADLINEVRAEARTVGCSLAEPEISFSNCRLVLHWGYYNQANHDLLLFTHPCGVGAKRINFCLNEEFSFGPLTVEIYANFIADLTMEERSTLIALGKLQYQSHSYETIVCGGL